MATAGPRGWYLAREVGLLAGVSGDTIGQWARYRYIRSSWSSKIPRVYSFQDVAEAIAVHELIDRGIRHAAIKRAIEGLRDEYGDWPLQTAPLATPDRRQMTPGIALKRAGGAFDVGRRRGQSYFSFVELRDISVLLRRGGWALRGADDITRIEVDPDRLSGQPTIRDRRVPAEKVARIAHLSGGLRILASEYGVTRREADDAVRWYERAQRFGQAAA
jgi:uncharacterized protein (DUF433 family)/DNA-binding transcriptional MerR regulator